MKIRILTTLIVLLVTMLSGTNASSQGAQIVHDPVNLLEAIKTTAEVYNLGQTIKELKAIQEKVEEIKEKVDWIKQAKSVIQLLQLIQETTCIFDELDGNMRLAADIGVTTTCYQNFRYRISINKLLMAIDQINSVLSQGTKMEPAQRLEILAIVLETFTQSQLNFHALNNYAKLQIFEARRQKEEELHTEFIVNQLASHYGE